MTAKKILALFGDYLRPRVRMLRPRGYERPSDSNTDIRFQAWLRVVCHPEYPIYEKDLIASYVQCTADRWQQERLAEFEMALGASLDDSPFVHITIEEVCDFSGCMIPVSAAAICAKRDVKTIHRWIESGLQHEKRGAYYYVSVNKLREKVAGLTGKGKKKEAA